MERLERLVEKRTKLRIELSSRSPPPDALSDFYEETTRRFERVAWLTKDV